jgi:hypothetical protein
VSTTIRCPLKPGFNLVYVGLRQLDSRPIAIRNHRQKRLSCNMGGYLPGRRELTLVSFVIGLIALPFNLVLAVGPTSSVMTAGCYDDVVKYEDGFIAANRWGLELFEIDAEENLISTSNMFTSGRAEFVDAEDDLVVASNLDGSVEIFRMDGRKFQRIGRLNLAFHPVGVKIIGDYLYIGGLETAITVYDISNPYMPRFAFDLDFSGYPHEFKLRNDTLFVAAYHGGVVLLDVADRSRPQLIEQYLMPDYVYGLELDGYLIYACAHRSGLYTLDIRWNGNPPVIGHNSDFGSAREAMLIDDGLIVLDGYGALRLVDVSIPSLPETIWSTALDFNSLGFQIVEDMVFVANWIHGVKLLELQGKTEAELIDNKVTYSVCKSLSLADNRIFAAASTGGLMVFDDDLKPSLTPGLAIDGDCLEIRISGNLGFLSSDENGLNIVDLSDPGGIKTLSNFKSEGWVRSSSYTGERAFLANWQGIVAVDLADINFPVQEGFFDTDYGSTKIEHRNDTVFVAASSGLELYDVSDPENICFLNRFSSDYPSQGIDLIGETVILSSGLGGVYLLSLSGDLELISHIQTGGKACDVELRGDRIYIAESDSGLTVWDISWKDQPRYIFRYQTTGRAHDLAFLGDRLYAADFYGVSVFDPVEDAYSEDRGIANDDGSPEIILFPNPVRAGATIRFEIDAPAAVTVNLYDILGRKVEELHSGFLQSGETIISWENRDLSTGCYFVRVSGKDFATTKQMMIVK